MMLMMHRPITAIPTSFILKQPSAALALLGEDVLDHLQDAPIAPADTRTEKAAILFEMAEIAVLHMMAHLRQVPRLVASQAAHSSPSSSMARSS